jgi:osmotically-inducible protein OsmY
MKTCKFNLIATAFASVLAFGVVPSAFAGDPGEQPERTAGQLIDDASITTSVKTKLLADERTHGFDINVDTRKGKVTLSGGADSLRSKMAATELALSASGVVSVDNQLVVAAPGSEARQAANTATASGEARDAMSDTGEAIDDTWITPKVKSKLLADENVTGSDISVETKDNVVHLVGVVRTVEERAVAIRIAENTEGVRGVEADDLIVRKS